MLQPSIFYRECVGFLGGEFFFVFWLEDLLVFVN